MKNQMKYNFCVRNSNITDIEQFATHCFTIICVVFVSS